MSYTPSSKQGKAAVARLGRTKATGGFNRISSGAAEEYESKGVSPKKAKEIGNAIAGKIYWAKVRQHQHP